VGGGGHNVGLGTIYGYVKYARDLPAGHIFQAHIQNLVGYNTLSASPQDIAGAVNEFLHPDVNAPAQARDVTLGIKPHTYRLRPANITISVLNGNGVQGSAANAAYELSQQGYKIVLPPNGKPVNAPNFSYFKTTVYYDPTRRVSLRAARQVANLFGDADVSAMPAPIAALANGSLITVVVGQNYHGTIAPAPVDQTPKPQPPSITLNPGATLAYLRSARRRVHFRLELPHVLASGSEPEPLAPIRVYPITPGHNAVRLTFEQTPQDFWGIEETDWNAAPILQQPSFEHHIGGRVFDLYYSGPHLHMVVLKENGATYWVVNTVLDDLSNETMLAIAKGLRPLG
jgi:hypothetical protein